MNARIGIVRGGEVKPNRNGGHPVRLLQVEVSDAQDIQTGEQIPAGGEDFNPPPGSLALVIALSPAYKFVVGIDDLTAPESAAGERRLYAVNAANERTAVVRLLPDGAEPLAVGEDYAVRFNALKLVVDNLVLALNSHTHSGVTAGGGVTGVPVVPLAADITPALVADVRVPG